MLDQKSISDAVKQICEEKGIAIEAVIETIEAALAAAYRKDFGEKNQNIKAEFDLNTGNLRIFDVKTVVEDVPEELLIAETEGSEAKPELPPVITPEILAAGVEEVKKFNPKTDLQLKDALVLSSDHKIDDVIKTELSVPGDFGRMAAQTAKQVIIQKLRETERETVFQEFKGKEGEVILGTIQRREGRLVLVDLGRTVAILPSEEQINSENYIPGAHFKFYIVSVNTTTKGPEIVVSRTHPEIVKKLFLLEIPEIASGVVEIKGVAREAGARSKIAVWTSQENIDPIGSCIGQRGARIQTIISELKGEKVDIVKYSDDPAEFIANALSPAKILAVKINEAARTAFAQVADDQLSLAIGKAGQNVRLAARLTGWKIDIISNEKEINLKSEAEPQPENTAIAEAIEPEVAAKEVKPKKTKAEKPKKEKKPAKVKVKKEKKPKE